MNTITKAEVETIVRGELEAMTAKERNTIESFIVPPFELICSRSEFGTLEKIFCVGLFEGGLILYDDVEEEFCIGYEKDRCAGVLKTWELRGLLSYIANSIIQSGLPGHGG